MPYMKERVLRLIYVFLLFVLIFMLQRPVFMLWNHSAYHECTLWDCLQSIWHGLPLDLSMAGYLTAIPAVLITLSVWFEGKVLSRILDVYFAVISVILSSIAVVDMFLYEYWGFRLDTTPLFYFMSSPREAVASVPVWMVAAGTIAMLAYAAALFLLFHYLFRRKLPPARNRVAATLVLTLLTAALFIPIRGGFTVSVMNTGKVYFSSDQRLNHLAVNPAFNLLESLSRSGDFKSRYRFMDDAEASRIFSSMQDIQVNNNEYNVPADTAAISLFRTSRPDISLVVLESFSNHIMSELGGKTGVTPSLDSLSRQGVLFTNFYANSFRTDRGLVSILSGYPAQPTASIMKHTRKASTLPSLAAELKKSGYDAAYYYGGDADFTNMRSYLVSSGFGKIISDTDFLLKARMSKWGAPDHELFNRFWKDYSSENHGAPRFRVIQTSSSHEPFDVPYRRLDDKALNAFAYTDSCIGEFMNRLRDSRLWDRTVVIFIADHLGCYPHVIDNYKESRYRIPLILAGGAVKKPLKIESYGSQQDIAATILAQLGLSHSMFAFSKDMLDSRNPHFAFFTVPDAMGYADADNAMIFDNASGKVVYSRRNAAESNTVRVKAYLQKLYDDIDRR